MTRIIPPSALPLLVIFFLAGCSSLTGVKQLEQAQNTNLQLLEQQAVRLEMQEEFLAQLAESQQESNDVLARVGTQLGRLVNQLAQTEPATGASAAPAGPGAAATAQSQPQEVIGAADIGSIAEDKLIVGRNEWVWLQLMNRNLKARIDTGAFSSSLSATELLPFERDGQQWIRFRVPDEEHPDGGDLYEAPLVKYVRIRQASADKLERRPVIRLTVRLGEFVDEAEFNLTNREDMLYPVLLGRSFLRDVALVDVAQKFTQPKYVPDLSGLEIQ